jgi:hypothetical protein
MIDSFPRTGSTTLVRVLNTHPDINCCMEPFHPRRYGGEFSSLVQRDGNTEAALEHIRFRWNGLKHVWEADTGWPFVGQQHLNDDLIRRAEIILSLRRRNLLRQVVSGYISKCLDFWVGTSAEFYARLDGSYLPPISIPEVAATLATITEALKRREHLLCGLTAKRLTIYYEDFFGDDAGPDRQYEICHRLFAEIGHRPLEEHVVRTQCSEYLSPNKYRWANNDVYARIPGSELLDKQLGNDVTGHLFI